jgi:menaquinol-cytochrome c reductase cytochrome b/c subunit
VAVSRRVETRRRQFQQYKADVKSRGKPFYPYAMFHDTIMSLVVVSVIVGLTILWKFTADESTDGGESTSGILGKLYDNPADPGTINFVPRPDWYFYFLFYLLRIFKWPESVILGTVGIPTLLMILLFAVPFIDRRPERRLSRRPVAVIAAVLTAVSMGVLTYKGATARESLGSEALAAVDSWSTQQGGFSPEARRGAEIFAQVGCLQCHIYLGSGSANVGAPELSDVGASGQNVDYFKRYVANPSAFGNNVMPAFENLGDENLTALATFLAESKGGN